MEQREMRKLLGEWWRLPPGRRREVHDAVDRGLRLEDEELRPMAVALATRSLSDSGWALLRKPAYIVSECLMLGLLLALGWWPVAVLFLVIGLVVLSVADGRARRLRPCWRRAVVENADSPN